MIEIRRITPENMRERSLDGFVRTQEVRRVYRKSEGEYRLVEEPFTMDWDTRRKRQIAKSLVSAEFLSFAAFDGETLAGFVSVESRLRGDRLVLDIIQVNRPYRGKGLGKKLFRLALAHASAMDAKGLYISAFSAEETIAFYRAMGCVLAAEPIASIAQAEPMDLQLTCDLR